MKYDAEENSTVGSPSATPVTWTCHPKGDESRVVRVTERLWVDARKASSVILKCDPGQVVCVEEKETP